MSKSKIVFLNNTVSRCGVYQYGKRLYDILQHCKEKKYVYEEVKDLEDYKKVVLAHPDADAFMYNWSPLVMPWLSVKTIQKRVPNIGIQDVPDENDIFDIHCFYSFPERTNEKIFDITRPLFENFDNTHVPESPTVKNFIQYNQGEGVPIFGTFGFAVLNKGFEKVVQIVNEQYDRAIVKILLTKGEYVENSSENLYSIISACFEEKTKEGIKILLTTEFFEEKDLLCFLASNDMNIFMYDYGDGVGVSSVIDYALSVRKPIGISNSFRFRHIHSPKICLDETSIRDCMKNSVEYCDQFREKWSNENLRKLFLKILDFKDRSLSLK